MSDTIEPFQLAIPDAQLTDLRDRLRRVRWPDRETVDDQGQGPPLRKIEALVEYWRDRYDWRRCEAMLNAFGQHRTTIDGLGIHFLHVRSPEPDALALVLTHGWPGSVLEFHKMIGPLTDPVAHGGDRRDAFHLVVPSLPGFGFSDKPTGPGWGVPRIADAWITLMGRLGYDRWGAQGGDWGAAVTTTIGHEAPAGCVGIHLNFVMVQPTPDEIAAATPHEHAMLDSMRTYQDRLSGYAKLQATRPQTVGCALADSPVGQAAWIYALFQDVSDSGGNPEGVFTHDEMLDDIMLYWLPNAAASSARLYWESMNPNGPTGESGWSSSGVSSSGASMSGALAPMRMPTAISVFPRELVRTSRRWAEARFSNLVHFNELEAGGHFAALEQPGLLTEEIRTGFRGLRT